ncbi:MAG: hypothetical protein GC159_21355 [Phycisphaera sp.]|nr:hypothetical protein [Phycisphaera sp.]
MPADFKLDIEARVVYSRAWGVLHDDDMNTHMQRIRELVASGEIDAAWVQILDFSAVEEVRVTSGCVRQLVELNPWPAESRRAAIAPDTLIFGLVRMYELASCERGHNVRAFSNPQDAFEWLGVDPPDAPDTE